jgi:hypothetical protein
MELPIVLSKLKNDFKIKKFRYWVGMSSLLFAFQTITNYRQRRMTQVYFYFNILVIWNIICYLYALAESSPNIGDGYVSQIFEKNITYETLINTNFSMGNLTE